VSAALEAASVGCHARLIGIVGAGAVNWIQPGLQF
jgi:hypothetical protein